MRAAQAAALALAGLIALAVSLWGLFASEHLPAGHDVWVHAVNGFEFARCLAAGVPWPRWLPDLCSGLGSPSPLYYGPLPHQLTGRLIDAGLPVDDALRAAATLAMGLSFAGMYVWGRRAWGRPAGFLAGVLYLFAPYHLVDLYLRFSYPELLGLAVAPWLFWLAQRAAETGRGARAVPVVLAVLALTHNLSALLFGALLAAFLGCLALDPQRRQGAGRVAASLPLAAGLAAFFWMPALLDAYLVRLPRDPSVRTGWTQHLLAPGRLLESHWPGTRDHLPLYPGRLQLGLAVLALGMAVGLACRGPGSDRARARSWAAFAAISLGTLLLMLEAARPVWEATPLTVLQFPWRFLGPAALGMAWVAPVGLRPLRGHRGAHAAACAVLAGVTVAAGASACRPEGRRPIVVSTERLRSSWQTGDLDAQFMPAAALFPVQTNRLTFEVAAGQGSVRVDEGGPERYRVHVSAASEVLIEVRIYRFEGWEASVDGRPAPLALEEGTGGMRLTVPAGKHEVEVTFGWTALRWNAALISAATLVLMMVPAGMRGWRRGAGLVVQLAGWGILVGASIQVLVPMARRALPWGADHHAHRARTALSYRDHHAALTELERIDPAGPHGAWAAAQLARHRRHGLHGRFFSDHAWRVPWLERTEYVLAYHSDALPGQPAQAQPVSLILSARLEVDTEATYDFAVETAGRGALLIDGRQVVREGRRNQGRRFEGAERLARGGHDMVFLFRKLTGESEFRLWWRPQGAAWSILPLERLTPAPCAWVDGMLDPLRALR